MLYWCANCEDQTGHYVINTESYSAYACTACGHMSHVESKRPELPEDFFTTLATSTTDGNDMDI